MERASHPINSYAESFFRRRKSVIAFLLWFAIFNICFYLEMAGSSKSTFLFGNFSSPPGSLSEISQRFFFYFYWIGSAILLVSMIKTFISIPGNKKTGETETSGGSSRQDNRKARSFFTTAVSLEFINIVAFLSIIFILPSDKSVGQVFKGVLGVFVY
jgi:hypothetical protein